MVLFLCIMQFSMVYGARDPILYFPVDKQHGLSEHHVPGDLRTLRDYDIPTTRDTIQAHAIIVQDLSDMFDAALNDGISLAVTSGYRSYERQKELFSYWKQKCKKRGLSDAEAELKTNEYCAYPGHSEHQLGTALDIVAAGQTSLKSSDENNKAWQWLHDNCEKYGFVLSYPEGKIELTGYMYEPWHFRWLGKKYARNLKKQKYKAKDTAMTSTRYLQKLYDQCH